MISELKISVLQFVCQLFVYNLNFFVFSIFALKVGINNVVSRAVVVIVIVKVEVIFIGVLAI